MRDVNICLAEFEKFYDLLMKEAPTGYTPWFFPCEKNGKDPSAEAILNINPYSKGSWHHESARLNKLQCIEHIKRGYNIGISARKGDPLILIDIDNPQYVNQLPANTLTAISRKRIGAHAFCWDKDGTAKINLPTDNGEVRSDNQYLLSCGSYVPFDLSKKKDNESFQKLSDDIKKDVLLGYYTLKDMNMPRAITFSDLPEFFQLKEKENIEAETKIKQRDEKKKYPQEGKYTELFNLRVSDIVGAFPSNKRFGHPLHDSDTDANFSLSSDGALGHCWRHMVSLNAVQYLCVKAGYANCEDAGTPHKGRGLSKIIGDKNALEVAYKEALAMGLITERIARKNTNVPFSNMPELQANVLVALANKKPREATEMLTNYFEDNNYIYTLRQDDDYEMWIYKDGVYVPSAKTYIQEFCREVLGEAHTTHFGNEVIAKIAADTFIDSVRFFSSDEKNMNEICVANGILNIETKELRGYNPDKIFFNKIPVNYNPDATCPAIDKFLNEVLETTEDKIVIYELIGNCLLRHYKYNKAVMLCGSGSNGKSILLQMIKQFLGHENCVSIPLQQLEADTFALSELHKKFCNIAGEIPDLKLEHVNNFKQITGEDSISASRKFLSRLHFYSFCKQFFSANQLPITNDMSFAFFRRWILLNFPYCYIPEEEWNKIKEEEKIIKRIADKNLLEKLTTAEEKSGLLNEALKGIDRLKNNSGFSLSTSSEGTKIKWIAKSDSFLSFCMNNIQQAGGERIAKEELRQQYNEWCQKNNVKLMGDKHIREILINSYGVYDAQETNTDYDTEGNKTTIQLRFWKGIKFKNVFNMAN